MLLLSPYNHTSTYLVKDTQLLRITVVIDSTKKGHGAQCNSVCMQAGAHMCVLRYLDCIASDWLRTFIDAESGPVSS